MVATVDGTGATVGRPRQIQRAFAERDIEAAASTVSAIEAALAGEARGLSRTGTTGTDGILAVSADRAVLWEAEGDAVRAVDLGAYSNVQRKQAVLLLSGDGVEPISVCPGDAERADRWLDLFSFFGITEASSVSVNSVRPRLRELIPNIAGAKVDRVVAALARELAEGETIDAAVPAKRLAPDAVLQGVLVLTADRLFHVEASPPGHRIESYELAKALSVSSGFQPLLSTALVSVAQPGAIQQFAVGSRDAARQEAARFAALANDRIALENQSQAQWWEKVTLPRTNVGVLEYYGGHPIFPLGAGTLTLKLSTTGVVATGGFGTHFAIPWSGVTGFGVEPSDIAPRRIPTLNRFLAVGPSAVVLKHKAYEQSHLVLETNDGEMIFAISQTPQKLRSRLAPYLGAFPGIPYRAAGVTYRTGEPADASTGGAADPVAMLRSLAELRDAGVLTDDEFESKKAKILDRI